MTDANEMFHLKELKEQAKSNCFKYVVFPVMKETEVEK